MTDGERGRGDRGPVLVLAGSVALLVGILAIAVVSATSRPGPGGEAARLVPASALAFARLSADPGLPRPARRGVDRGVARPRRLRPAARCAAVAGRRGGGGARGHRRRALRLARARAGALAAARRGAAPARGGRAGRRALPGRGAAPVRRERRGVRERLPRGGTGAGGPPRGGRRARRARPRRRRG